MKALNAFVVLLHVNIFQENSWYFIFKFGRVNVFLVMIVCEKNPQTNEVMFKYLLTERTQRCFYFELFVSYLLLDLWPR